MIDCDPKGDHRFHLLDDVAPHTECVTLRPDPALRGVLDPLRVAPEHLRQDAAVSFLRDLLPGRAEPAWETAVVGAVDRVITRSAQPTCLQVVHALAQGDAVDAQVGKALEVYARSGLTQLGFADPAVRLPAVGHRQVTYLPIRDLPGPEPGTPRGDYSQAERIGEQIVRLIAMFAMHLMGAERERLKLFSFDEGWRLLGDPAGRSLLASLQRMGRSELAVPIISTQLVTDTLMGERESLENLIGATFVFGMRSEAEAGRALALLGLDRGGPPAAAQSCSSSRRGAACSAITADAWRRFRWIWSCRRCCERSRRRRLARERSGRPRTRRSAVCRCRERRSARATQRRAYSRATWRRPCTGAGGANAGPGTPAASRCADRHRLASRTDAGVESVERRSAGDGAAEPAAHEPRRVGRPGREREPVAGATPQLEADPLVSNGLGSPLCRGAPGGAELSGAGRRNCETSGFVAAAAPTGNFGLDVHIDTGVLGLSSGGLLTAVQDLFVAPLWMAVVWAVHALVVMLEWCFTIDLLDSGSVSTGVALGLRQMQASFTYPWLALALAVGAVLAAYEGIVRRRVAETLGHALLALAMTAGGIWVMLDPVGTVGELGAWANGASLGTLAVTARGAPTGAGRALGDGMTTVFSAVVEVPWCYLEFGDVGWCRNPARLDSRLHSAALRHRRRRGEHGRLQARIRGLVGVRAGG